MAIPTFGPNTVDWETRVLLAFQRWAGCRSDRRGTRRDRGRL